MTELTRAPQRERRLLTTTSVGAFIGGLFAFLVPVSVLWIGGLAWIGGWVPLLVLGIPFVGGAVVAALVAYRYVLAAALLVYAVLYSPTFIVAAIENAGAWHALAAVAVVCLIGAATIVAVARRFPRGMWLVAVLWAFFVGPALVVVYPTLAGS